MSGDQIIVFKQTVVRILLISFFTLTVAFSQTQLGIDIDGEAARDFSGESVSLSSDGSRVAIGAFNNDGNGSSSGHALSLLIQIYDITGKLITTLVNEEQLPG